MASPEPKSTMPYLADLGEIIAREPAIGTHPLKRIPVEFRTVEKVLLATGLTLYACRHCGAADENLQSVVSHQGQAHRRRKRTDRVGRSLYTEDTIKAVIRAVKVAKREPGADYARRAAQALNEKGYRTAKNLEWDGENVSRIYRAYEGLVQVNIGGGRLRGSRNRKPAAEKPNLSLLAEVNSARVLAKHLLDYLDGLVARVEAGEWDVVTDPQTAEKAQRWDQMQALLGKVGS